MKINENFDKNDINSYDRYFLVFALFRTGQK